MAIRLADLEKPLEPVILPSGQEVKVVPVNGLVAQLQRDYADSGDPKLLWQMVGQLIPDAPEADVLKLSLDQCAAVIQVASGNAKRLMAEIAAEIERERATKEESAGNSTAPA